MATAAQIEANRRNSQKSTGPRTAEGKLNSSRNALQSGLHAESLIIRGEDPAALAQLAAEYHAEFLPTTPRQRDLVDTLVHNQWLIRRLRLTEADLHAQHFQSRDEDFNPKYDHHHLRAAHPLADAFAVLESRLQRLQTRLNSLERSSRNALKELNQLQKIGFVPPNETERSDVEDTTLTPDPRPLTPAERSEASPVPFPNTRPPASRDF